MEAPAGLAPGRAAIPVGVAIGAAIIVAGVIAWAVPLAAIVLVWPILFAVPGWVVVRRVAPSLPSPGAVGVAVVASVVLSAHVVDVVARVVGFGRPAVVLSAVLLVVAMTVFARLEHPWLGPLPRPSRRLVRSALREDAAAWLLAALVGGIVLIVLFGNGWRETTGGWVSGGWNWSDLLVHVAIGASIEHGNFPPEVPYLAGEPLTYHWFADFHGAIAASAAGIDLIPVYFATSALLAASLALLVWALALRLTDDRRVALVAAILVCLGGGMGWLRLVGDLVAGDGTIASLIPERPYDNSWSDGWPWFRIASIMGTGFLPHRATTFGLPGLVSVVLLAVTCLGRRPAGVLFAGILAALLAPFHFHAFPASYLIVGLFVATSGAWRATTARRDAVLFLAPVVLALPFVIDAILLQSASTGFRFVAGWSEARFADGPAAVLFFYATNLGLPFALAVIAAVWSRGLPNRWFLTAWLASLFVIPNVVTLSAVEFDMNKAFQIMWVAVAILAAWLIRRWPPVVIGAVVAVSAISPALIVAWHLTNPAMTLTTGQAAAARWIDANTEDRAIFVTDAFINSPVDLAGRLRVTSFGPYVSNLGYDPSSRAADVHAVYCDGPDAAVDAMARYGARYVLSSGGALDCTGDADGDEVPTDFAASDRFETVYEADGVSVWRLAGS